MIIVLDTSAAIEIVLQREHARELGNHIISADWVIAPSLFIPEATNVFWKYYQFDDMPLELCEKYIENTIQLPDEYFNEIELYKEAFSLGCLTRKPIYDMFFLVLARRHSAYIMTRDASLTDIAKKHSIRTI